MVGGYVREAGKWPGRVRGSWLLAAVRFGDPHRAGRLGVWTAWASGPPVQCVQAASGVGPAEPVLTGGLLGRSTSARVPAQQGWFPSSSRRPADRGKSPQAPRRPRGPARPVCIVSCVCRGASWPIVQPRSYGSVAVGCGAPCNLLGPARPRASWGSPAAGPSPPGESAFERGRLPRPEAPGRAATRGPETRTWRRSSPPAGARGGNLRTGETLHLEALAAGPRGRPARFPAAVRGAVRPPWRRLGAPAQSPRSTRPGVPERRGGVVRPRRDGRVSRTDGRWPRSRSRGGRGRPRGGRLGQALPPGTSRGADVRGTCPERRPRPGRRPRTRWGTGDLARSGVGAAHHAGPRRPGGRTAGRGGRERAREQEQASRVRAGRATSLPPLPSPPPQRRRNATPRLRLGARPAGDEARGSADATWLILPVVICLSQRLSHACASISNRTKRNCEWLIKSVIVYLIVPPATRITVVILELIRARNRDFGSGVFIGLENRRPSPRRSRPGGGNRAVNHDNRTNRARLGAGDGSIKFLPYQLSTLA